MSREFASNGPETKQAQTSGTKRIKLDVLQPGQASDIGTAPPSRLYTRDYKKCERPAGEPDTVSPYLGNPLAR